MAISEFNHRLDFVAMFMVLTMIASASFTSQNIADAIAARASEITNAHATADQRIQAIETAKTVALRFRTTGQQKQRAMS
jgi:hypothetical protein